MTTQEQPDFIQGEALKFSADTSSFDKVFFFFTGSSVQGSDYLSPEEARKLAAQLIHAADVIEKVEHTSLQKA